MEIGWVHGRPASEDHALWRVRYVDPERGGLQRVVMRDDGNREREMELRVPPDVAAQLETGRLVRALLVLAPVNAAGEKQGQNLWVRL